MNNELPANTMHIPPKAQTLDLSKPIQTRDGRRVVILCTDAKLRFGTVTPQPIVGIVYASDKIGSVDFGPAAWCENGRFNPICDGDLDLVNTPPTKKKVKVEVRLYRDARGHIQSNVIHEGDQYTWDQIDSAISGQLLSSATIEMEYPEVQP